MIEYDPNRDWLRDLKHLGTSWTIRRILRAVGLVGLYAVAMSVILLRFNLEGHRPISGTFSLLGVILSIVLAFRTNSAYDRWWEGRQQWGTLVNHSRNLAIQLDAILPAGDRETRARFARLIADFARSLSGHLRGEVDPATLAELGPGEDDPDQPPGHVPARIAREIVVRLHEIRREGTIDAADLLTTKGHTQALLDVSGACERIRKTPIPFSYSVFIKLFLVVYAAILPIGLVPEYGYLAVPLVMLIMFALLGLELMAEEIEEPFGRDCNDLPTDTLATMIGGDVEVLLGLVRPSRRPVAVPYRKVF